MPGAPMAESRIPALGASVCKEAPASMQGLMLIQVGVVGVLLQRPPLPFLSRALTVKGV